MLKTSVGGPLVHGSGSGLISHNSTWLRIIIRKCFIAPGYRAGVVLLGGPASVQQKWIIGIIFFFWRDVIQGIQNRFTAWSIEFVQKEGAGSRIVIGRTWPLYSFCGFGSI